MVFFAFYAVSRIYREQILVGGGGGLERGGDWVNKKKMSCFLHVLWYFANIFRKKVKVG